MRKLIPVLAVVVFLLVACTPLERQAYEAVVASKAFLDSVKAKHPECAQSTQISSGAGPSVCMKLAQATAAKDSLIDAVEVYCAGPNFNAGNACNPPAKGTPAAVQATAKVQAALAAYNQTAADLKGVL